MAGVTNKKGLPNLRKKQYVILIFLIIVLAGVALLAGVLGTPKKVASARPAEATRKAFGSKNITAEDMWRTEESAKVRELQQQLLDEQTARTNFEKKVQEDLKARAIRDEKVMDMISKQNEKNPSPPADQQFTTPPPGIPGHENFTEETIPPRGIMRIDLTPKTASGTAANNKTQSQRPTRMTQVKTDIDTSPLPIRGPDYSAETFIPAGTFMKAVLLSGVDAPTGGQAQQNPHPVIIEAMNLASLPNKFRADYKNCRITGNAVGDLSSERAYIRLDRMACVSNDGGAIEINIKGYVADASGKAGVRGRLVSKQGQVLANAMLAGVVSGIGTGIQESATTSSVSALGSTSNVKDGKEFQAGIGKGVGDAMNQLARYYITLAEKMFPVIEIDAGLPVEIVVTRGVSVSSNNQ